MQQYLALLALLATATASNLQSREVNLAKNPTSCCRQNLNLRFISLVLRECLLRSREEALFDVQGRC